MKEKIHLSLFCGGQSTEHEVSIRSAHNVLSQLNQNKYHVTIIYVDDRGVWHLIDRLSDFLSQGPKRLVADGYAGPVTVVFGQGKSVAWQSLRDLNQKYVVDCAFSLIHGRQGEDGCLQGVFECLGLPYVGASLESAAICMSKELSKRLLKQADFPVVAYRTLSINTSWKKQYGALVAQLGEPLFVKPVGCGSSVGIQPIHNESMFRLAVQEAFRFDHHVIIEPRVIGREIECAVLGDDVPEASVLGEIILNPHYEYYSYDAKYLDTKSATIVIPAILPADVVARVRGLAMSAFQCLHVSGMARVDFFLAHNGKIFINELNTIPGFTDISMYPQLWEASGISYAQLLDRLIQLAFSRHAAQQRLIHNYHME